jgi:hypothetical protein
MSAAARLALARILRAPRSFVPAALWIALALAGAAAERTRAWPAASHVLLGALGAFALPLFVYVIVGATMAGQGLARAARPLVAFGADPVGVAAATLAVSAVTSAVVGGALSAAVAVIAHGPSDPPLARDALTAAWIGALGGLAYAAFFTCGAALVRGGSGRVALLFVDWIFGAGSDLGGALTPRAHLRSLLGGAPVFELSQRASALCLVALAAVSAALTLLLARRRA